MIVLQLGCFTSYAQSDTITIPLTGEKDSALVPIELLRIANSKMIDLEYEKEINTHLRSIIQNDSVRYNALLDSHDYYENKSLECEEAYSRDTRKYKKQRNIFAGTTGGLLIILAIILL